MKKIFTIAMVIALVAAFTLPAMAETKFSFKGAYRVRGFMLSNPGLQSDQPYVKRDLQNKTLPVDATGETASQSWMDMRFRMESTFTVSDRLSVVTRFDALDNKKYGYDDNDYNGNTVWNNTLAENVTSDCDRNSNIDFDRAYMVIKTDFGKFAAGRMAGGTYGNVFLDTETERDRVRFDTMLDKWVISLVYEKQEEHDSDTCTGYDTNGDGVDDVYASDWTDADLDFYYAAATYMSEDLRGGLLVGVGNAKHNSDSASVGMPAWDTSIYLADPFFDANFGDFNIKGEAQIRWGKFQEFDRDLYAGGISLLNDTAGVGRIAKGYGEQPDVDWDAYAWNLEGSWASGPFGAEIGYAWVKGEDDPYDDKHENVGGLGDDWGKAFILTNTDSGFETSLGNHEGAAAAGADPGNLSSGSTAALNGCKMFYLGGSYSPLDNLKVSALYANSKAESPGYVGYTANPLTAAVPANSRHFSSDHGSEYDLTINWDIYDNLNYTFIAAFLDVGDYWQFGNPYRELENTWCFWQQLQLSF